MCDVFDLTETNKQFQEIIQTKKGMNRNTYTSSDYTVPSLSIASSRSKRSIPTKDTNEPPRPTPSSTTLKTQTIDRINRPPIFSSKVISESRVTGQTNYTTGSHRVINTSNTYIVRKDGHEKGGDGLNLNRNVYLEARDHVEKNQSQVTFRAKGDLAQNIGVNSRNTGLGKSPSGNLLRNPESNMIVSSELQRKISEKKIDINKSLFQRKIKKLLQEADFYDKELNEMYKDNTQMFSKQLLQLEQCRKNALSFQFSSTN